MPLTLNIRSIQDVSIDRARYLQQQATDIDERALETAPAYRIHIILIQYIWWQECSTDVRLQLFTDTSNTMSKNMF